jgi:hypothetical protein
VQALFKKSIETTQICDTSNRVGRNYTMQDQRIVCIDPISKLVVTSPKSLCGGYRAHDRQAVHVVVQSRWVISQTLVVDESRRVDMCLESLMKQMVGKGRSLTTNTDRRGAEGDESQYAQVDSNYEMRRLSETGSGNVGCPMSSSGFA